MKSPATAPNTPTNPILTYFRGVAFPELEGADLVAVTADLVRLLNADFPSVASAKDFGPEVRDGPPLGVMGIDMVDGLSVGVASDTVKEKPSLDRVDVLMPEVLTSGAVGEVDVLSMKVVAASGCVGLGTRLSVEVAADPRGESDSRRAVVEDVSKLEGVSHDESSCADAVDLKPRSERRVVRRRACLRIVAVKGTVCSRFEVMGDVWGRGFGFC
jgi:hypothetical protein